MKILVACTRIDEIGGSELYHYELCKELLAQGHDVTLCTYLPIDSPNASTKQYSTIPTLLEKGIQIVHLGQLTGSEVFDIGVVSQPHVTQALCNTLPKLNKVSIIHSPYRSEEVVEHASIKHYIAVDVLVYRHLKNVLKMSSKHISLIYNPVDPTKFNTDGRVALERITGLYVGHWNDPLRRNMFNHIVQECVDSDWDLFVVGGTQRGKGYPSNIKFFDGIYNVELLTKAANFTVGLGGRTLIEGWMSGIPGYIYKVTPAGEILEVTLNYPPKVSRFYNYNIVKEHIKLYTAINEKN